jgi:hypothetical protein
MPRLQALQYLVLLNYKYENGRRYHVLREGLEVIIRATCALIRDTGTNSTTTSSPKASSPFGSRSCTRNMVQKVLTLHFALFLIDSARPNYPHHPVVASCGG